MIHGMHTTEALKPRNGKAPPWCESETTPATAGGGDLPWATGCNEARRTPVSETPASLPLDRRSTPPILAHVFRAAGCHCRAICAPAPSRPAVQYPGARAWRRIGNRAIPRCEYVRYCHDLPGGLQSRSTHRTPAQTATASRTRPIWETSGLAQIWPPLSTTLANPCAAGVCSARLQQNTRIAAAPRIDAPWHASPHCRLPLADAQMEHARA